MRGASGQERSRSVHRVATRHGRRHACGVGACLVAFVAPRLAPAQVVHGTISSAVAAGRVPGAVVILTDSSLTTYARALTSDSGTFTIGAGAKGRFHLKVMRIGFRPTESRTFELSRDTTINLALTDIPVVLPAVTTRDRSDCRLHPDTTEASIATFALWDQARTAILAAAITLERHDYRFAKILHYRLYDVKHRALRDINFREVESRGSVPWTSLPADRLRRDGYAVEDDSGMTFFAPDLDVLLSPYFTEEHCFRLTASYPPVTGLVGVDFEPALHPRHVEIRGTLWVDSASSELRQLRFTFVNLPISAPDTLLGGEVDFTRLASGAWILPGWSIRMPTPIRRGFATVYAPGSGPRAVTSRSRWRLTADYVRVAGGDLRAVKRDGSADSIIWRGRTGNVRVIVFAPSDTGTTPAPGVIVRLAGSAYGGYTAIDGSVRFDQILPGSYLFEATTPLHDVLDATTERALVTVRPDTLIESRVRLKPLQQAAAEVCDDRGIGRHSGVLAGHVSLGAGDSPMPRVKITVEWPGGDAETRSRDDGYYRICGVPMEKLLLVRASAESYMATETLTLGAKEIVRQLDLRMRP